MVGVNQLLEISSQNETTKIPDSAGAVRRGLPVRSAFLAGGHWSSRSGSGDRRIQGHRQRIQPTEHDVAQPDGSDLPQKGGEVVKRVRHHRRRSGNSPSRAALVFSGRRRTRGSGPVECRRLPHLRWISSSASRPRAPPGMEYLTSRPSYQILVWLGVVAGARQRNLEQDGAMVSGEGFLGEQDLQRHRGEE